MDFTTTNSAFWQSCNPVLWCSTICQAKLSTRVHMKFLRLTKNSAAWDPISLQSDHELLRQACLLSSQEKEKLHIELHMACYGRKDLLTQDEGNFTLNYSKDRHSNPVLKLVRSSLMGRPWPKKLKQLKVVCSCVAMNEVTILSSSLSLSFLLVQIVIMLCSYRKQRKTEKWPFPLLHIFIITLSVQNMLVQEKDYSVKWNLDTPWLSIGELYKLFIWLPPLPSMHEYKSWKSFQQTHIKHQD